MEWAIILGWKLFKILPNSSVGVKTVHNPALFKNDFGVKAIYDSAQFKQVWLLRDLFPRSPFNLSSIKHFTKASVFNNWNFEKKKRAEFCLAVDLTLCNVIDLDLLALLFVQKKQKTNIYWKTLFESSILEVSMASCN